MIGRVLACTSTAAAHASHRNTRACSVPAPAALRCALVGPGFLSNHSLPMWAVIDSHRLVTWQQMRLAQRLSAGVEVCNSGDAERALPAAASCQLQPRQCCWPSNPSLTSV